MATYTKLPLSGSINGKQIFITATTSGSATPIHTAVDGTGSLDEIYLYAYNDGTSSMLTSILWGGTTEPNDVSRYSVLPRAGRILLVDGKLIQNSLVVSAYTSASGFVAIDGFVNRIS